MMKKILQVRYQVLAIMPVAAGIMISNRMYGMPGSEWAIGAFMILAFEIINPAIGIFCGKWWRYAGFSFLWYLFLVPAMVFTAAVISVKTSDQIGDSAMIYLVIMYYPLTLALSGIVRLVYLLARRFFRKDNS